MRTIDPEQLLVQVNQGKEISSDDVTAIVAMLEFSARDEKFAACLGLDRIYDLITIVGKLDIKSCRHSLEHFFDSREATTVAHVMEVLCGWWGETSHYLDRLVLFALGTPWDLDGDCQEESLHHLANFMNDLGICKKISQSDLNSCGVTGSQVASILDLFLQMANDNFTTEFAKLKVKECLNEMCINRENLLELVNYYQDL